jgi:hypothetical protein
MSTYPDWATADRISSSRLRAGQTNIIVKSSSQDVTDSTTFVDDDELAVELDGDSSYHLTWHLAIGAVDNGGGSEPHINTEYSVLDSKGGDASSSVTALKFCQGPAYPGTSSSNRENTTMVSASHNLGTDREYGASSLTSAAAAIEHHQVSTTDPVTIRLRFCLATNPAGAGDTCRILAGSFVTWIRTAGV